MISVRIYPCCILLAQVPNSIMKFLRVDLFKILVCLPLSASYNLSIKNYTIAKHAPLLKHFVSNLYYDMLIYRDYCIFRLIGNNRSIHTQNLTSFSLNNSSKNSFLKIIKIGLNGLDYNIVITTLLQV